MTAIRISLPRLATRILIISLALTLAAAQNSSAQSTRPGDDAQKVQKFQKSLAAAKMN